VELRGDLGLRLAREAVSSKKLHVVWLAAIVVLSAGLHLAWDARVGRMPSWDQSHHLKLGIDYVNAISEHRFREQLQTVREPYPPGYHLLLAGGTAVVGPHRSLGLYVNLVALAVIVASTYFIGTRLANGGVGLLAAALAATYPGMAVYAREALIEYWLAAAATLTVALLLASRGFRNGWVSAILGVVMGFGLLLKPSFAFCVWLPVLFVAGPPLIRREWKALRNAVVAGGLALGIAAVWYYPQREAIAALGRINRADGIRWGHTTDHWLGFLKYVDFLQNHLMSKVGAWVGIGALFLTIWKPNLWILHAWVVGTWAVVVFGLVFRDAKYMIPTLPAMALLVACAVDWLRPAWLKAGVVVVLAVAQAAALAHAEFGSANLPLDEWFQNEDKWSGVDGGESWAVPEIVAAAQRTATRKDAHVGVVMDLPRLNGNVLAWQARRTGAPVRFVAIVDSARDGQGAAAGSLARLDMILLKTGSPGAAYLTDLAASVSREVREQPKVFRKSAEFELADGSRAELYVVAGPSVREASRADVEAVVAESDPELRNVAFGDRFRMLGFSIRPDAGGVVLRIAWEAMKETVLDRMVAVHVLGEAGTILAQADYPQDPRKSDVEAGFLWIDSVKLPPPKLAGATEVAVQLYIPGAPALPVDKGRRDWGDTRLHVPLPR
jgi:4-amino-4-deoxy-L-arabinose transferase-like glycosyltransferase